MRDKLGEGSFCVVKEIAAITLKRQPNGDEDQTDAPNQNETDEADFPLNLFQNKSQIRDYMSKKCSRKDENSVEHSRYALKQLKPFDSQKQREDAIIDLSMEAQFLSYLNHPRYAVT